MSTAAIGMLALLSLAGQAGPTPAPQAVPALSEAMVEWSAGPHLLADVIEQVCSAAAMPYVLVGGLEGSQLIKRVHVPAFRGPAYQAALVAAELGELDVLFLEDLIVWQPRGRCPISLRVAQDSTLEARAVADGLDRPSVLGRRVSVVLDDATLSFAASAIAEATRVPVVLTAEARATQVLVTLDAKDRTLGEILDQIARSCGVFSVVRAGVVWWTTSPDADMASTPDDRGRPGADARAGGLPAAPPGPVASERSPLAVSAAWPFDGAEAIEAQGSLPDLSEAFRLAREGNWGAEKDDNGTDRAGGTEGPE